MTAETLKEFFKKDQFAALCGLEILEVSAGRAVVRMPVAEQHKNGLGGIHGGALFTLADFAFAVASNSHGTIAVAINASMNFMKSVSSGILLAEARELSVNPKIGTYLVEIKDEAGNLVAAFQGLVYRKKDPLPL